MNAPEAVINISTYPPRLFLRNEVDEMEVPLHALEKLIESMQAAKRIIDGMTREA